MKLTLEFDIPLEQEEYENCRLGSSRGSAIDDILNFLREKIKYDDSISPENKAIYEELRGEIVKILDERDLLE